MFGMERTHLSKLSDSDGMSRHNVNLRLTANKEQLDFADVHMLKSA